MRPLNERESAVLSAVIHAHTEFAEPVGSRTISRQYLQHLSPATIRNTMMDLADIGLLSQPHTSAGREPTVEGYRYYISMLMEPPHLVRRDRDLLDRLLNERLAARDEDTVLVCIARSLAEISHLISVAFLPSFDLGVLERIDLVALAESRLLVVLQMRDGPVDTLTVELDEPVKRDLVPLTAQFLNERLAGLTIGEIRRTIGERLRDVSRGDLAVVSVFLREGQNIFDLDARANVHLEGRLNILNQPEFSDRTRLVALMEALDDRPLLQELRGRVKSPHVEITVGTENRISALAACSLLTRGYRVGSLAGTLAIVGPMRMPYRRLVAALEHAGDVAEELLS